MLPDTAAVRVLTCDPPLTEPAPLVQALDKLFAQFQREGRCTAWDIIVAVDGHAVVVAWDGPPTLSGCSHDKVNGVLNAFAPQALTSPPILVAGRLWMRGALKQAVAAGTVTAATPWWDVRADRLGAWRQQPQALEQGWLWPLVRPA